MRNMSFSMSTEAFLNRTKDVTRRLGWWFLKPGDVVMGVEQAQGLKKGEHVVKLGPIRVVSTKREPLADMFFYGQSECNREGFPTYDVAQFVATFMYHNKVGLYRHVNRIEFEYVDE